MSLRKYSLFLLVLALLGLSGPLLAQEHHEDQGNAEMDPYYRAIEDYFKVTPAQVANCNHENVLNEDLPVVFFIAQRAGVDPDAVLAVQSGGLNWTQVAWHFKLNPWIFFTPLPQKVAAHTYYEKSNNKFLNHNKRIFLTDLEFMDWVNLKFLAEEYGRLPEEVVAMRMSGKSFREINEQYIDRKDLPEWDVNIPNSNPTPNQTPGTTHSGRHHRGMGGGGMSTPSN